MLAENSHKKMDLQCLLILALALFHTGEAIDCYQCNSYTDAGCDHPFDVEAAEQFLKPCLPEEDGKDYYCRKIRQKIRGDVQIIRSCGHEVYVNLAGETKDSYTTVSQEYNTDVTTCKVNKCNGSTQIKISTISVMIALVLTTLFK